MQKKCYLQPTAEDAHRFDLKRERPLCFTRLNPERVASRLTRCYWLRSCADAIGIVLYKYFPFGGLQRDFMRIALECQKRGHQIPRLHADLGRRRAAGFRSAGGAGQGVLQPSPQRKTQRVDGARTWPNVRSTG